MHIQNSQMSKPGNRHFCLHLLTGQFARYRPVQGTFVRIDCDSDRFQSNRPSLLCIDTRVTCLPRVLSFVKGVTMSMYCSYIQQCSRVCIGYQEASTSNIVSSARVQQYILLMTVHHELLRF